MNVYSLQDEAAAKVVEALKLGLPETQDDCGCEGVFDPWEIFPCFFGHYSSDFDEMALLTLRNIRDRKYEGEGLAHQMFREYLCRSELCDYGTSPRVCFPTTAFEKLLPDLIDKWQAFSDVQWGDQ